jgi:hypothetical protein
MTEVPPGPARLPRGLGWPLLLLAVVLAGFGTLGTLPLVTALTVALAAVTLGALPRLLPRRSLRPLAPVAPLVGLAVLADYAVPTGVTALYGGVAALVLLIWLADDPERLPGGSARALNRLLIPTVGLGIAWASAFLLPGGVAPLGAGVALLVVVVVLAALLLRSPEVFDRDAAASS